MVSWKYTAVSRQGTIPAWYWFLEPNMVPQTLSEMIHEHRVCSRPWALISVASKKKKEEFINYSNEINYILN